MTVRIGGYLLCGVLMIGAAMPSWSQSREETLADIRQQLSVVYVEVQKLKRELSTTGGANVGAIPQGSALQRIDAVEAELQRLTAKTEELEFRIGKVVSDGTNRIGDLEFRLCELEANCDIGSLGKTTTLGGDIAATNTAASPVPSDINAPQLAVGEQADYDAASSALDAGEFRAAADRFAQFTETYPGGALSGEAHYYRGVALQELGETANAARAFLQSFSGAPDGPLASDALYSLGLALNDLGQAREACVTLGEVSARFPNAAITPDAVAARTAIGCN